MAVVFRLATKSEVTTYDFQTGGLKPHDMSRSPNGDGWMTTSWTMVARTTDANIISAVNSIDELAETCDLFWGDNHRIESVWLEESATSETTKRSLIQSVTLTPIQDGWMSPLLGKTGMKYNLTVIHSAAWEKVASAAVAGTNVNCLGGTVALAAIDGSLPGRINNINFGPGELSGAITTIWGGIKPQYESTGSTDFNPIVQLELGNLVSPAVVASDSDNASPVGTTDNIVSYACTTSDVKIIYETLNDAFTSTLYSHWIGDYQVLLRCHLTDADTVRLHVDWGYKFGTVFNRGPDEYVSSTDWFLYEMGTVSAPVLPREVTSDYMANFEFQLYAQRLGGATTLLADCLILIPAEHYFKMTNCSMADGSIGVGPWVGGYQLEDGTIYCFSADGTGGLNMATQFGPNNLTYPIGGGTLVIAAQQAAIQDVDDYFYDVSIYYYERFRTHGE